jgi:hypothetical protein
LESVRHRVLLPKRYQFKNDGPCVDHGDNAHPLGCLDAIRGRQWRTPQLRKGSQILRICFWRGGATTGGHAAAAQGRSPCVAAEPPESRPVFCEAKNAPK